MNPTDRRAPLLRLRQRWGALSVRERRALAAAAAVLLAAGAFWSLEAILRERARLARALPAAQARLEQMREAERELAQLRGLPVPAAVADGAELLARLRQSLDASGLALEVHPEDDSLRVSGEADFDRFVVWLAQVQRDLRLSTRAISIERHATGVAIELLLSGATPAPAATVDTPALPPDDVRAGSTPRPLGQR